VSTVVATATHERWRPHVSLRTHGVYVALAVVVVFNLLFTPNFATMRNVRLQLVQVTPVVIVALGSIAVLAPGAQAAPPSAQYDGTYACSNGQSIDVFVSNHSLVGYVDGRGVAPRAFQLISDVSLEVQDGAYAGDVISLGVDSGITGPNGKSTNPQTLTGTSTCVQSFSGDIEFVVDQGAVDFFGIDPKYLGSTVSGSENASITVYVTTQQLQHR